jgi:glucose-1-phosphate thymidylyltransferase
MISRAVLLVRSSGIPAAAPLASLRPSALNAAGPAPMVPVANRPLILHALDAIEGAGLREAVVVVEDALAPDLQPVLDEEIATRGIDLKVIGHQSGLGFGAAMSTVRDFIGREPFILHLADGLQRGGLRELVERSDLAADDARVLTWRTPGEKGPGSAPHALKPRVEPIRRLRAAPPNHAGVYAFGAAAVDVAATTAEATDRDLGPPGLVEALGARGGRVEELDVCRGWRFQQDLETWLEGNRLALEGIESHAWIEPECGDANCSDTVVQGGVMIHPTAELRSSTVRGPAIIGPMARLADAYVGPYTSVGAGVLIEAAEVENSIILPGASIRYVGGRLESSIIGARARVFRHFRLPKAMRLTVGEGAEVALA